MKKNRVVSKRFEQEFHLFLIEANKAIKETRRINGVVPEKVVSLFQNIEQIYCKKLNHRDSEYLRLKSQENIYLSKISTDVGVTLLSDFKRPLSWVWPLRWFILTNRIISPESKCRIVGLDDDGIILKISAEASIRDIHKYWPLVASTQKLLSGNDFKTKRSKRKFNEHLRAVKNYGKYIKLERKIVAETDMATGKKIMIDKKKEKKLKLISKHNQKAVDDLELFKKEAARLRKVYSRKGRFSAS